MNTVEKIRRKNKQLEEELLKASSQELSPSEDEEKVEEELAEEYREIPQEEVETPVIDEDEEEKWKHKYNVLQGKYNAEVPRLQQEVKKLQEENAYLLTKLELLEKVVEETKAQPEKKVEDLQEDEDTDIKTLKEDFPEIYRAVKKIMSKTVPQEVKTITEEMKQQKTANFFTTLKTLVPNWEELNVDEGFLRWLKEVDLFTGKTRHELLLDAYSKFDVNRVASFFKAYSDGLPINRQQAHVAPQSRSISTPATNKKILRQSQIEDFYRKKALGKISSADAKRFEQEIISAMKEGRIINE